jgi:hypothetical protein
VTGWGFDDSEFQAAESIFFSAIAPTPDVEMQHPCKLLERTFSVFNEA